MIPETSDDWRDAIFDFDVEVDAFSSSSMKRPADSDQEESPDTAYEDKTAPPGRPGTGAHLGPAVIEAEKVTLSRSGKPPKVKNKVCDICQRAFSKVSFVCRPIARPASHSTASMITSNAISARTVKIGRSPALSAARLSLEMTPWSALASLPTARSP